MLNLIKQIIHHAVIKAFNIAIPKGLDKKLGSDHYRPAFLNKNSPSKVWDIPKKNWRLEEIGFFNPDCEEPGPVITINGHIYYQDVNTFVDWLKDITLFQSIEKTQEILP